MDDNNAPFLLDATRLIWRRWEAVRPTGIDRICSAWLEHYGAHCQAVIIHRRGQTILPMGTSQALFRLLETPQQRFGDVVRFRAALAGMVLRHGLDLGDRLPGRGRLWLNAGHTGLDVPDIANWVRTRDVRPVYLVHDLIPITHPQFCREGERVRHETRMRTVLDTASGVIANSAHTLDSLQDFANREGKQVPPAGIAWPGAPKIHSLKRKQSLEPTFVVLGTLEGRKNHKLLLSIWQDFVETLGSAAPRLAIVGRRGWQAEDVFATLDEYDFKGKVLELGPLDDDRLEAVLASARALLFPSFAEGFGMPLVEAIALGVPVIASDLVVFEEIGQDVPELLSPSDQAAWKEAILDYARDDSDRRDRQLVRLEKFHAPDWSEHFKRVNNLLDTISR